MGCIYIATNTVNGKQYIGQSSTTMDYRKRCHEQLASRGGGRYFQSAIRKYGSDSFRWRELHSDVANHLLNDLEKFSIANYRTRVPDGYNIKTGGKSSVGWNHSDATKEKCRKINLGRTHDAVARENMSKAHKKPWTKKQRETYDKHPKKMPEHFGKQVSERMTGHKVLQETREKIRESLMGHGVSQATREKIRSSLKARVRRENPVPGSILVGCPSVRYVTAAEEDHISFIGYTRDTNGVFHERKEKSLTYASWSAWKRKQKFMECYKKR